MKKLIYAWLSLCLVSPVIYGQVTKKVRAPQPSAFYSPVDYKHDGIKGYIDKSTRKFIWDNYNSNNKIIDNLENPPGTIVIDGDLDLRRMEDLVNNPHKINFTENYLELPYEKNETLYRIPVTRQSSHHSLKDPDVQAELELFVDHCAKIKNQVPGSVTIKHSLKIDACEFLSFASVSSLFQPYHQRRLNLACVFLKLLKSELNWYVGRNADPLHQH